MHIIKILHIYIYINNSLYNNYNSLYNNYNSLNNNNSNKHVAARSRAGSQAHK